ncbi:MAG: hypothetical protein MI742_13870 [Desulfobacterales bacterium]|nr:hypothetical protein [Desulfobacterales bacterium]
MTILLLKVNENENVKIAKLESRNEGADDVSGLEPSSAMSGFDDAGMALEPWGHGSCFKAESLKKSIVF